MTPNGKEYADARVIGAYLMQSIIDDGQPTAHNASIFMATYAEICAKAFGVPAKQISVDIADTFKKTYAGFRGF